MYSALSLAYNWGGVVYIHPETTHGHLVEPKGPSTASHLDILIQIWPAFSYFFVIVQL